MDDILQARQDYIELIKRELLGPGSEISIPDKEHELISTSPDVRYSIGILFPRENRINADSNDPSRVEESAVSSDEDEPLPDVSEPVEEGREKPDATTPSDEENLDEEIGLATQNMPSSAGMTFFAFGKTDRICCTISFASYRHALAQDCRIPFYPRDPEAYSVPSELSNIVEYSKELGCLYLRTGGVTRKHISELREKDILDVDEFGIFDALYKLCTQLKNGYVREPHEGEVILEFGGADYIDSNHELFGTTAKLTALRRKVSSDLYAVTVMLVNDSNEKSNGTRCIFQPKIQIETKDNSFVFREYGGVADFSTLDDEEKSLELQYRNKKVYATGLGTSVNWTISDDGNGVLFNDFFPESEVPNMDFNLPLDSNVPENALSMKYLSDFSSDPKADKITSHNVAVNTDWSCFCGNDALLCVDDLLHAIKEA